MTSHPQVFPAPPGPAGLPAAMPRRAPLQVRPWLYLSLLLGSLVGVDVTLIGRLSLNELFLAALLIGLGLAGRLPVPPRPVRTVLILALVWLAAQLASDLVNQSSPDNLARGVARAVMTLVLVYSLYALFGRHRPRLHLFFVGLGLGLLLLPTFFPTELSIGHPWKFGYGTPVTFLAVGLAALAWYRGMRVAAMLVCAALGVLNLFLGFRSMGGICLMTALVLGLSVLFGASRTYSTSKAVAALALVLAGGTGVVNLYSFAAENRLLGEFEREKFLEQVDERGVLLSGRSEWLIGTRAFLERPLLGHGSWAENEDYAVLAWELSTGSPVGAPEDLPDVIPTHSHLLGALVEGGILAGLIWIYVLALITRAGLLMVRSPQALDPVIAFALVQLAWNVLFSPYGLVNRVISCMGVVVAAMVLMEARGTPAPAAPGGEPPR